MDLKYYGNSIFSLSRNALHKSKDNGKSWQNIPIDLPEIRSDFTGKIEKIDVAKKGLDTFDIDLDKIWIACENGIIVSENLDGNFSWSYHLDWDGAYGVNFENGYGWSSVPRWGSASGIIKKAPNEGWTYVTGNYEWKGGGKMFVDPQDPANIVFAHLGYDIYAQTQDGGAHWNKPLCPESKYCWFTLATIWNNKSTIFGFNSYSQDYGKTWDSLGIKIYTMTKAGNTFYAFGSDELDYTTKIFTGTPNNWTNIGLKSPNMPNLAATDSTVFAATNEGKLYRGTWQK